MLYATAKEQLRQQPRRFLVTGAAGFIGSNLVEALLRLGQTVIALDNLQAGCEANIQSAIMDSGNPGGRELLTFIKADIRDAAACEAACRGVDVVLHQAALCSVPASIENPLLNHGCNVDGFLNILAAARQCGVRRIVYASSCAVYGDTETLPLQESLPVRPGTPYALAKSINEEYARLFSRLFGIETIGLRYFNVFGKRQDPEGPYAAVIPRWTERLLSGERAEIYGDGLTTRDFCPVDNIVQANLLAATTENPEALNRVYNVGSGAPRTLNDLHSDITTVLVAEGRLASAPEPVYKDFRAGDIRHSHADITLARKLLGYVPVQDQTAALRDYLLWHSTR